MKGDLTALALSLRCPPPGLSLPYMEQTHLGARSNTVAFVKPSLTIPSQADLLGSLFSPPTPSQSVGRGYN